MSKIKETIYFLVKVKKPFGIYGIGNIITMRETLVKGAFKDKVEIIEKAKNGETTEVKYEVEKPKKETKKTLENNKASNDKSGKN